MPTFAHRCDLAACFGRIDVSIRTERQERNRRGPACDARHSRAGQATRRSVDCRLRRGAPVRVVPPRRRQCTRRRRRHQVTIHGVDIVMVYRVHDVAGDALVCVARDVRWRTGSRPQDWYPFWAYCLCRTDEPSRRDINVAQREHVRAPAHVRTAFASLQVVAVCRGWRKRVGLVRNPEGCVDVTRSNVGVQELVASGVMHRQCAPAECGSV